MPSVAPKVRPSKFEKSDHLRSQLRRSYESGNRASGGFNSL